jgi:hypothetical protein
MIGSTDSHASLATTQEDNFFGKGSMVEPGTPERFEAKITGYVPEPEGKDYTIRHYQSLASGLAAVWATANTREALFDAMACKEVYATTGTRLMVRVFAGWDFVEADVQRPDFARDGYTRGVPMGGDLTQALPAKRRRLWSVPCVIPMAPTWTASRSSKAGSTARERCTRRCTTWRGRTAAPRTRRPVSCPPWATRWTCNKPPIPTALAVPCCWLLERPELQSPGTRLLLCARSGDSHPALDHIRRCVFRHGVAQGCPRQPARPCLHLAHLVCARAVIRPRRLLKPRAEGGL